MNIGQEQIDIESYFAPLWTYTTVEKENVLLNKSNLTEWVRLRVLPASARIASLGANALYRYRGIVTVQIYIRDGIGVGRANVLADLVDPLFRSVVLGNIHFGVPEATKMGNRDGWYGLNVDCPYYREEFAS